MHYTTIHRHDPDSVSQLTDIHEWITKSLAQVLNYMSLEMFELTGFQRDLLYVINGKDKPSGQTIKEELEQYVGEINHGRLYPNLDTLVEKELVEKGQIDRRTNYYNITQQGKDLIEKRREWERQYLSAVM